MRTAICSGSFDPITLGHLDIIRRAAACFDRVCVCVSPNAEKRNQMFTPEQKLQLVRTAVADLPNVEAELPASAAYQHFSSSMAREMIRYHQPLENYLPASIVPLVREMTEKKEG